MNKPQDARQYAPATQRNREPILEVLKQVLPATGNVLEIASGTGEHAVYFAPRLSPRQWIPSDPNPLHRASIAAWRKYLPCESLQPPLEIDVRESIWMVEEEALFNTSQITAIVNINMIHISPWAACLGLMAGAGRILPSGGILYLYGPFKRDGKHTAPSNAAFDESLRAQNPEWGVRNLEDVVTAASTNNLSLLNIYQMPANNLSVVFNL
ncbi:DUF938 domain-containing protein [Mastigocladus laminosus UU774]|nr:DUF938 domain-containing protein [Mastigocladus laminosus UU774]